MVKKITRATTAKNQSIPTFSYAGRYVLRPIPLHPLCNCHRRQTIFSNGVTEFLVFCRAIFFEEIFKRHFFVLWEKWNDWFLLHSEHLKSDVNDSIIKIMNLSKEFSSLLLYERKLHTAHCTHCVYPWKNSLCTERKTCGRYTETRSPRITNTLTTEWYARKSEKKLIAYVCHSISLNFRRVCGVAFASIGEHSRIFYDI